MYKINISYMYYYDTDTYSALLSCIECDEGTDNNIFRMPIKEELYCSHLYIGLFSNTDILSDRVSNALDKAKDFVIRRRSQRGIDFTITI